MFVRPEASPVVAVGDAVVDATPTWLREWAITQFGTNDKHVLVGSILVLLLLMSLVTGALAVRRRAVGLAGVAVLGAGGCGRRRHPAGRRAVGRRSRRWWAR